MMKLLEYLGWVGIGSIALAAGVWVGMAAAFRRGRPGWAVGAVGMAVLALGFARWNSARITAIEPDPKEIAAAIESGRTGSIYEEAAREEPLYRRGGKQRRIGTEAALPDDRLQSGPPAGWNPLHPLPQEAQPAPAPRYLPRAELKTANRWDILNLFFARLTFWGSLPLLAFLYLRRFNAREGNPFPLPVSGRWTEILSPPEALRSIPEEMPEGLTTTLDDIARRGETFLCLAPRPASLERLWRLRIGRRGWWELPVDDDPPLRHGADLEFLFEALWFNRMAFFLPDRTQDPFVLGYLHDLLASRARLRATTRTPVTIVIPAPVAERFPRWESFTDLAAHTGIRICIDLTPSH